MKTKWFTVFVIVLSKGCLTLSNTENGRESSPELNGNMSENQGLVPFVGEGNDLSDEIAMERNQLNASLITGSGIIIEEAKSKQLRLPTTDLSQLTEIIQILRQAAPSTSSSGSSQITATRQGPCQCALGVCGCCSRILLNTWKQKACVNVTYDPDEFSFTTKVTMNDRILYTRTVSGRMKILSGKNPRPFCVPIPRISIIKACVRFYNVYFQGRNVHVCMNMEGKFRETTLFKVGLDCLRLGANGVALVKPEDGGGLGQVELLPEPPEGSQDNYDDDDYDDDDDDDDGEDDDDDDDGDVFDY